MTQTSESFVENDFPSLLDPETILEDYKIAYHSRQVSLIGRREVLSGKAKFGIFGAGKESAQLAMARAFAKGDWRSGYYRDQTLMFALGLTRIEEFYAQLYAHADLSHEPFTGGRAMNAHFLTPSLNPDGSWRPQIKQYNSSADVSPTASQMPRLVGLGYASRLYRELTELKSLRNFSRNGNEIAWGTIGNASCAEGMFWESINAIGVLKAPVVVSIYDDGYGISVTNEHQITKGDLSAVLAGFAREENGAAGFNIFTVPGWDYPALIRVYQEAANAARQEHIPAIIHVTEVTQPQGHSTSGSHERYKSKDRLQFEKDKDCVSWLRNWILEQEIANDVQLTDLEKEWRLGVEAIRAQAWEDFQEPLREEIEDLADILDEIAPTTIKGPELLTIKKRLLRIQNPIRKDVMVGVRDALMVMRKDTTPGRQILIDWKAERVKANQKRYSSLLYASGARSALDVPVIPAAYTPDSPTVRGFEILNACFDQMLARDHRLVAFGEDLGRLGGVNQSMAGLQAKYGELRVADAGIRETTIVGQAIGMALRGLRPIAEIQYLDYLLYALQIMSDDLATLHWRTVGQQSAPVIIRTRGHRLEGIWHSGSPMAGIINLVRGMHVIVPRNMVQAAGFYNTLLASEEPAIVVEVLNGYRLRERMPDNIGAFTVPLGVPEVLRDGDDVTIVTYGPNCQLAQSAARLLANVGIEVEIIDVQTLLPFDRHGIILESLKKTSRIIFLDEDVPGGASAYMMQKVIEEQGGFHWLDSEPITLSAQEHRPAYSTDGDYWSKPNIEQIFETVYEMMNEVDPVQYPRFY